MKDKVVTFAGFSVVVATGEEELTDPDIIDMARVKMMRTLRAADDSMFTIEEDDDVEDN